MITSIEYINGNLRIIDQRLIPYKIEYFNISSLENAAEAIKKMIVRGAPAIGIVAAFGFFLGVKEKKSPEKISKILINTRPTAKDLYSAVEFMKAGNSDPLDRAKKYLKMIEEKEECIVKNIASIIKKNSKLLTHCHTGSLAVFKWGTAFGGIAYAHCVKNKNLFLWIKETRPRFQGRITAWEARERKIPHKIIVDSAAAYVMNMGLVDQVIVGADRIALNGDTANKIGTLDLAILANYYNIPLYVAAPKTTFDINSKSGKNFIIEERNAEEIKFIKDELIFKDNNFFNPAFDIVPYNLITGIITEDGLWKTMNNAHPNPEEFIHF